MIIDPLDIGTRAAMAYAHGVGCACCAVTPPRPLPSWTLKGAHFSDDQHRVWLRRELKYPEWIKGCERTNRPRVAFILHNPSTAGLIEDDATSRRGISFARALDASDMVFVNAMTGIATNAEDLDQMADPIGPMADEALRVAADWVGSNGFLIAGWGVPKGTARIKQQLENRFNQIKRLRLPLWYLELTKGGYPKHPLYIKGNARPQPWRYVGSPWNTHNDGRSA